MHIKVKIFLVLFFILLPICFSAGTAHAQSAGDACSPTKFTSPIWVGGAAGGAGNYLVCDGANWVRAIELDNDGNVGIGQASPAAPLHVGGAAIIGTSSLTCAAITEGAIRYNTTSNNLELCDGSSWDAVSVGACGDATPDAFDFTDLVNQSTSTQVTSNILQISGLACTVGVSVSGEGSPQYRTCSDSGCSTTVTDWTSSSGTISNNEYVQLRLTSSAAGGDTYSATLAIGTSADVWNVTPTGDCSSSPAAGTVCTDGSVYAGDTPDGNTEMFVTRCDAGMTWDGSACTGTRLSLSWNDGEDDYVTTGYTSAVTGQSNTTNLATTDANSVTAATQDHVAAVYCNDLTIHGKSDWYLPARTELNVIYGNKTVVANFSTGNYWSSSEYSSNSAWRQSFSDGNQNSTSKNFSYAVRCARRD